MEESPPEITVVGSEGCKSETHFLCGCLPDNKDPQPAEHCVEQFHGLRPSQRFKEGAAHGGVHRLHFGTPRQVEREHQLRGDLSKLEVSTGVFRHGEREDVHEVQKGGNRETRLTTQPRKAHEQKR
jgi:hypothetical protein